MVTLGVCASPARSQSQEHVIPLPSSKVLLEPVPGNPRRTNSFPVTVALNPSRRYLAILNNGWGTAESDYGQSIAILDLETNELRDIPDRRFSLRARQTYFIGLAFSTDGTELYASVASYTDPTGERQGNLGNGIAVYSFEGGKVTPKGFLKIPLQPLLTGIERNPALPILPPDKMVPYPAGLTVIPSTMGDKILVADNLSDNALLLDAANGHVLRTFDLSQGQHIPASYPYADKPGGTA
jgi:hypothetical protein